ncbi:hypothetical protein CCP3SC15_1610007 [Gammaproteobacteria bacterium]
MSDDCMSDYDTNLRQWNWLVNNPENELSYRGHTFWYFEQYVYLDIGGIFGDVSTVKVFIDLLEAVE